METLTIVLVEDDDGHAALVERNLRRAGLENQFFRFTNGQQALDALRDPAELGSTPCVLLLDIKMPWLDGVEVLRRLKGDPRTSRIPVIMLTTADDPREIQRCYELGCNIYITKPVEYEQFVDAVNKLGFFLKVVKVPPRQLT
jgi:CheY-like chemotaxis protein